MVDVSLALYLSINTAGMIWTIPFVPCTRTCLLYFSSHLLTHLDCLQLLLLRRRLAIHPLLCVNERVCVYTLQATTGNALRIKTEGGWKEEGRRDRAGDGRTDGRKKNGVKNLIP